MIKTKPRSASLYPFHLLRKTFLLWVIYVTCGMTDSVRGPTLLDLKDLINVEISEVATIFAFKSFGGFIGVIMVALLLDRFKPSVQYLFLFIICKYQYLIIFYTSQLNGSSHTPPTQ